MSAVDGDALTGESYAVPPAGNLRRAAMQPGADGAARRAFIARLPDLAREASRRWSLTLGPPFEPGGVASWVAPATNRRGDRVVLKLSWRHEEGRHEPDALRRWGGAGAVRLHADARLGADHAMVLERCLPGTALAQRAEEDQDSVVAALLRRLWIDPGPAAEHPFRPLHEMCDLWAREAERAAAAAAVPDVELLHAGLTLFRQLSRSGDDHALLCTDLHAENVLAAEREPWLAIDPKPYVGDRAYDVLQHMLNCRRRLDTDPVGLVRRMADLTGLDAACVRLWLFARCTVEAPGDPSLWAVAGQLAP